VLPGTCKKLNEKYNPKLRFSSNPEFLRANSAVEDFINPDRIVIGTCYPDVHMKLVELYQTFRTKRAFDYIVYTDSTTAEFIKYASNIFLAGKVAFALEMNRLAHILGADGILALKTVGRDSRIGLSHLDPSKGKIPIDSPCLPKDLRAFNRHLEDLKDFGAISEFLSKIEELSLEK
jgi:UDPglucose 6-dehydrogenase